MMMDESFVILKLMCVFLMLLVTVLLVLCFEEEETPFTKFKVWEKREKCEGDW